ncbi:unnamed protein product [Caenorhabditis nigoni]
MYFTEYFVKTSFVKKAKEETANLDEKEDKMFGTSVRRKTKMEENLLFGVSAENLLKTSTICWTQNCTECAQKCSQKSELVKRTMETQNKEIDFLKTVKKPFEFSMGCLGQNEVCSEKIKEKELKQLLDDCQQKEKKVELLEGKIKDIVKYKETAEKAQNCLVQEILRLQSTIKNFESDLTEARHLNTELQLCNTKLNYASQATTHILRFIF